MPNKTLHQLLIVLTLILDACLIGTSILLAYWIRFESDWLQGAAIHKGANPPLDLYFQLIPLKGFIWILILRGLGLYQIENEVTLETGLNLLKASTIALISTLGAVFFFYHAHAYSRWVMILACAMSVLFLFFNRLLIQRFKGALQGYGIGLSRVAIVGFNPTARQLIRSIQAKARNGYKFIGVLLGAHLPSQPIPHRVLGETADVRSLVQKHRINELFITSPGISHEEILQIVHHCEGMSVQISVLPDLYEVMIGKTRVAEFDRIPVVKLKELPLQGWRGLVKRGLDIVISAFALVISSPAMLAIAIAVKCTSPGPIIFRQERNPLLYIQI